MNAASSGNNSFFNILFLVGVGGWFAKTAAIIALPGSEKSPVKVENAYQADFRLDRSAPGLLMLSSALSCAPTKRGPQIEYLPSGYGKAR
jgi:hypothetical protein